MPNNANSDTITIAIVPNPYSKTIEIKYIANKFLILNY